MRCTYVYSLCAAHTAAYIYNIIHYVDGTVYTAIYYCNNLIKAYKIKNINDTVYSFGIYKHTCISLW